MHLLDQLRALSAVWRRGAHTFNELYIGGEHPLNEGWFDGMGDGLTACADELDALVASATLESSQDNKQREELYKAACEWDTQRVKSSLEARMKPLPPNSNKKPSLDTLDGSKE